MKRPKRIPVREAFKRIGDDPQTMLLMIQLMDQILHARSKRKAVR